MSDMHGSQIGLSERIHNFVVAGVGHELTDELWTDFERLLRESDDACRLYLEYVDVSVVLPTILSSIPEIPDGDFPSLGLFSSEQQAAPFPTPTFLPITLHGTFGYFSSEWTVSYLIATVIMGIGALIAGFTYVSQPAQVAQQGPSVTENRSAPEAKMESVGRITGMVDCKWNGTTVDSPRVTLGRKYKLASGLMEITYDTGAKVILQGPVTYEVESKNGGFLSIGKLTGKVEVEKAKGFAVRTPTATVTDLGTEFGVEAMQDGSSEVHVITGAVDVIASADERDIRLDATDKQNAVRIEAGSKRIIMLRAVPSCFVQTMPSKPRIATVGSPLLRRDGTDTAAGAIYVNVGQSSPIDGTVTQYAFTDGYHKSDPARFVTPLIFACEADGRFVLTGIGESIVSTGKGPQRVPFRLVAGSTAVRARKHTFGHFDGAVARDATGAKIVSRNPGSIEHSQGQGGWHFNFGFPAASSTPATQLKLGDVFVIGAGSKNDDDSTQLFNLDEWSRNYSAQITVQQEETKTNESAKLPVKDMRKLGD
jgi:hypothetical protein